MLGCRFYAKLISSILFITGITFWIATSLPSLDPRPRLNGLHSIEAPRVTIGRINANATYIFGIPHIHRSQQNYVLSTLTSLLQNVPESHYGQVSFVVLIADPDGTYSRKLTQYLSKNFTQFIDRAMLQIIIPPTSYYPDFTKMNLNPYFFGIREKFVWTAKQNYDYAYLMHYCEGLGKYYIQLEDDITTHHAYIQGIEDGLRKADTQRKWFVIEYSSLGFIGKMFHSTDLGLIADFLVTFHAYKPVDWLLEYLLPIIACKPDEITHTRCENRVKDISYRHTPSLFQHMGLYSSLKGKLQWLKDNEFIPQ